jgi:uncharacterized membrane protein YfcA
MDLVDSLLLLGVGTVASIINTLAGGGSLITVPALVLVGAPGTVANGTNRVGILTGTLNAARTFSKHGVAGMEGATRILVPAVVGSVVGSTVVSQIADDTFEQIFGVLMIRSWCSRCGSRTRRRSQRNRSGRSGSPRWCSSQSGPTAVRSRSAWG